MTHLDDPVLFLATANAERSRAFYRRVLGLALVADELPALVFQVGDGMLLIQKVDQVHAAPYTALGWAVSDIRRTIGSLTAAGVVFKRGRHESRWRRHLASRPASAMVAWFRDPDGPCYR